MEIPKTIKRINADSEKKCGNLLRKKWEFAGNLVKYYSRVMIVNLESKSNKK